MQRDRDREKRKRQTDKQTETDNVSFSLLLFKSVSNNAMHTGIGGTTTRYLSVICYWLPFILASDTTRNNNNNDNKFICTTFVYRYFM